MPNARPEEKGSPPIGVIVIKEGGHRAARWFAEIRAKKNDKASGIFSAMVAETLGELRLSWDSFAQWMSL